MKMKQNTEAFGQNSRKLRVIYIDESNLFLSWNAILEINPQIQRLWRVIRVVKLIV